MIIFRPMLILLMLTTAWGCSKASDNTIILDASGKHPAGWAVATIGGNHPASFISSPDTCKECHGTDLRGGVSTVSCFSSDRSGITCHAQGPSGHPTGWSIPAAHGTHAKAAAVGADGMMFCAKCHGTNFTGGIGKSCLTCHTTAPHPPKPWFGGTYTHKNTDPSNSPACAVCHTNRANLSTAAAGSLPATPVIGTSGCFNNTLCHGQLGHPADWAATGHKTAAKAAAGTTSGLDYCRNCHGTDFKGSTSGPSCFSCHSSAPHAKPWLKSAGATTFIHSTTDQTNAPACGRCHGGGAKLTIPTTPPTNAGCFNNTLCHAAISGHPAGWGTAANHGTAAKVTPDSSHGFTYCTTCHNSDYVSGPGTSCKSCHSSAPHPAAPWRGASTTHTTTDPANASECSRCHAGGAKRTTPVAALAGATCFNNTLCHGVIVSHTFPNPGSLHRSSTTGCSSCHALGTGASTYPVAVSTAPDCKSCHKLSTATSMALMSGCSDCHGDAATGRPSLLSTLSTDFPKRRGQHLNGTSKHTNIACTTCHPFTSGDSRHGWSNRVKSTAAQINTSTGWNAANKTCSNNCHGTETWY